ncbi:XRE family transcriptional regulator [Streptomyces sp. N2-109]|uniref:XRE family transcriptional regulator n=1 Tax=Streptomyces gossypii TaxID=2883101 RepID=A0ABT2K2Z7_9ACTN|nr:XRE family transcriptional regulator [Streptomyces gossypii]MCT2594531.1 XRE family transcriptional regulator [Streptomyces gossypii]
MPRWKALPDELDPQIREFTSQLRRLVDRSGLSLASIADRTGYSKSSWERYLNGRLLAPRGATQALADVTGTEVRHLATMWELAERAWSRSEMRHDMTMEALQVDQARAALAEAEAAAPAKGRRWGLGRDRDAESEPLVPPEGAVGVAPQHPVAGTAGTAGTAGRAGAAPVVPEEAAVPTDPGTTRLSRQAIARAGDATGTRALDASAPAVPAPPVAAPTGPPVTVSPGVGPGPGPGPGPGAGRGRRGPGRGRGAMAVGGAAAALVVLATAVFALDLTGEDSAAESPPPSPAAKAPKLPAGVKCTGADCHGKDPEKMGCGGQHARTAGTGMVGPSLVEVRYSKVCGAAWARIAGAADGDMLKMSGEKRTTNVRVESATDAYTSMVPVRKLTRARACATLAVGTEGCVKGSPAASSDTP